MTVPGVPHHQSGRKRECVINIMGQKQINPTRILKNEMGRIKAYERYMNYHD